jgi:hypothetical protein
VPLTVVKRSEIAFVVCCCDAFNALTSDRSYRKALPLHAMPDRNPAREPLAA